MTPFVKLGLLNQRRHLPHQAQHGLMEAALFPAAGQIGLQHGNECTSVAMGNARLQGQQPK